MKVAAPTSLARCAAIPMFMSRFPDATSMRPWLLLSVLVCGCLAAGCPEQYTAATWDDPSLFAAVEREARMEQAGLPIEGGAVVAVTREAAVREGGSFALSPNGLDLRTASDPGPDDVERGLRSFLEDVAGEADDDYVVRFMESRHQDGGVSAYHGPLPDGMDLQALYDESVGGQPSAHTMQGDGWVWTIAYPTKSIVLGSANLSVDAIGAAAMEHTWTDATADEVEQEVRGWLRDAGLPEPASMRLAATDC